MRLGLGLARHLSERVEHGAGDCDGRSDHGVALHSLAEDDGSDNDDDDALEGVEDRRGDGADLGGEGKRKLVVEVEEDTRENDVLDDVHLRVAAGSLGGLLAHGSGILQNIKISGQSTRQSRTKHVQSGKPSTISLRNRPIQGLGFRTQCRVPGGESTTFSLDTNHACGPMYLSQSSAWHKTMGANKATADANWLPPQILGLFHILKKVKERDGAPKKSSSWPQPASAIIQPSNLSPSTLKPQP